MADYSDSSLLLAQFDRVWILLAPGPNWVFFFVSEDREHYQIYCQQIKKPTGIWRLRRITTQGVQYLVIDVDELLAKVNKNDIQKDIKENLTEVKVNREEFKEKDSDKSR